MRKIFVVLLLSWTLLYCQNNPDEMPTRAIDIILLDANEDDGTLALDAIQDALSVDVKSRFEFWKSYEPRIKEAFIPNIDATLRSFFDSEGFYDANFTVKPHDSKISVSIKQNKPVRIGDINITADIDLHNTIDFAKGEIFKTKKFIETKNNIIAKLLKLGYCSYELDSKAYVDLDNHKVDLVFNIQKGGICTFGDVTIKGIDNNNSGVVLSRVRAEKGSRFNIERIQQSYDALYALDAFDSVSIRYDRKYYNVVPVDISLTPLHKLWYFIGGVGYDSDVGPKVKGELTRKNFLDFGNKLKTTLAYSKLEQIADLNLFTPALLELFGNYLDFTANVGYSNLEYTGFMEKKIYARSFLTYTDKELSINAGIAYENIDISLLDDYDPQNLTQGITEGVFMMIYPFVSLVYDKRDSKLNPKNGYYFSGMVEYGLPYNEVASVYLKYDLEARYIQTFSNLTLAVVGQVGITDDFESEVPESKLFFAGGVNSNRAYGYKRMGVIFTPTRFGIDGAYTMANLTLEANYPIVGELYGAVFNDNTMLAINSYDFTGDIISAVGVGVRYVTPIGPIKVDMGMNAHDYSQYAIHFQIGQSF